MNTSTSVERSVRRSPDASIAFGALGDPARLRVLRTLRGGASCVCELAPALGLAPNLLSYHLRVLREAGLVEGTRRGRRVEYQVRTSALQRLAFDLVDLAVGGDPHEG